MVAVTQAEIVRLTCSAHLMLIYENIRTKEIDFEAIAAETSDFERTSYILRTLMNKIALVIFEREQTSDLDKEGIRWAQQWPRSNLPVTEMLP